MSLFVDQADQLQAALADTSKPTLVEFYATWCPHCQHEAPIVDELRREEGDRLHIVTIDTDAHPELAKQFGVESFPSWFMFKDGQEVCRQTGEQPIDVLKAAIKHYSEM